CKLFGPRLGALSSQRPGDWRFQVETGVLACLELLQTSLTGRNACRYPLLALKSQNVQSLRRCQASANESGVKPSHSKKAAAVGRGLKCAISRAPSGATASTLGLGKAWAGRPRPSPVSRANSIHTQLKDEWLYSTGEPKCQLRGVSTRNGWVRPSLSYFSRSILINALTLRGPWPEGRHCWREYARSWLAVPLRVCACAALEESCGARARRILPGFSFCGPRASISSHESRIEGSHASC